MTLSLPTDLHEAVEARATDERRALGDVIRDILREQLLGPDAEPSISGVGDLAMRLIGEGLPNQDVLDMVRQEFPDASTTMDSIYWYRSVMRRRGENVPTSSEAQRLSESSK
jgi:plasmid stability protein